MTKFHYEIDIRGRTGLRPHADPHSGRVNRFWTYDDACERFAMLEEDGHRCVLIRVTPEHGRRTIAPGLSCDPAA